MLFNDHLVFYNAKEHDVNYFTGTFIVERASRTLGLLVAYKKSDGNIHAVVTYHNQQLKQPIEKMRRIFRPANFERFLVDFKKQITSNIKYSDLIEVTYRRRTMDDAFTHFLDEEERELLHQLYLLGHITGKKRTDLYENLDEHIRKLVATRV